MERLRVAWTVLRSAVLEARDDDVATMAQALAYALFLAIPATALVVLGVFSLVADPEAVTRVVDAARDVMPAEAAVLLEDSLRRSTQSAGGGLVMTIVGFGLAVWSTTSAATTLMTGLTRAYDEDDERSFVRKRVVALLIVFALVLGAALVVVFLVLGPPLQRWLGSTLEAESVTAWAWWTLQWPILLEGSSSRSRPSCTSAPTSSSERGSSSRPEPSPRWSSGSSPRAASRSTPRTSARTTRAGERLRPS